jgi:hypothetical protein
MTIRLLLLRPIRYLRLEYLMHEVYAIPVSGTQMSVTDIDATVRERAIRDKLPTTATTAICQPDQ